VSNNNFTGSVLQFQSKFSTQYKIGFNNVWQSYDTTFYSYMRILYPLFQYPTTYIKIFIAQGPNVYIEQFLELLRSIASTKFSSDSVPNQSPNYNLIWISFILQVSHLQILIHSSAIWICWLINITQYQCFSV